MSSLLAMAGHLRSTKLYLVGSMAASKLLDGFVCAPRQLACEMHSPPLICSLCAGMQGDASTGGIGYNSYHLLPLHEGSCTTHKNTSEAGLPQVSQLN